MMTRSEFRELHKRIAARLRGMAAEVSVAAVKARLIEQAEEHERIAQRDPDDTPPLAVQLN